MHHQCQSPLPPMRGMSGFSGDLICKCLTPGGLIEIKSPLPLPYRTPLNNPGIWLMICTKCARAILYCWRFVYWGSQIPHPIPQSKPDYVPTICSAVGVVGTDIDRCINRGGPTCVHESLQVQYIMSLQSRDNIQAKCTELVVIRARMSNLLWCIKRSNSLTHSIGRICH